MRAGKLRHKIEIQSVSGSENDFGERVDEWTTDATVSAAIEPLRGSERLLAQQVQANVSHLIIMRYRAVTSDQRVKFGSRIFDIQAVLNIDERNRETHLACAEAV